jgi:hypothetical protein
VIAMPQLVTNEEKDVTHLQRKFEIVLACQRHVI